MISELTECLRPVEYDFTFLDGVFNPQNKQLADCYQRWGRALAVMDLNIYNLYGDQMQKYFDHHKLELKIHKTMIGEKAKSMDTLLSIVDSMTDFGIIRKEPVLVVVRNSLNLLNCVANVAPGRRTRHRRCWVKLCQLVHRLRAYLRHSGLLVFREHLLTRVSSFACAAYRRNTNFIRIPTTVIGLIDASVSIKVAVNYGNYKNRLGAYHAPMHTFLDFTFLKTLPEGQVRNGFAELIKISTCAHLRTFDLLDQYCEKLIATKFGRTDDESGEVRKAADEINRSGIYEMLKLETPNLHEIGLDRVIAYGHTWSPLHEVSTNIDVLVE